MKSETFETFARVVRLLRDLAFLVCFSVGIWFFVGFKGATDQYMQHAARSEKSLGSKVGKEKQANSEKKVTNEFPAAPSIGVNPYEEAYEDLFKYISEDLRSVGENARKQQEELSKLSAETRSSLAELSSRVEKLEKKGK